MLRPGVLASPDDRNERQVLVLCLPRRTPARTSLGSKWPPIWLP